MSDFNKQPENLVKNDIEAKKQETSLWFRSLRDQICAEFEKIEEEYISLRGGGQDEGAKGTQSPATHHPAPKFERKAWQRDGGGGGEMSVMKGGVFEKVGVNISTVHGQFSEQFAREIPGAAEHPEFFATGISLVAHMCSPLVPAVHMNTRFIVTAKSWFGGGADLTPMYENASDTEIFHSEFQKACDGHSPEYYPKFKKWCDEYFFLKHRGEPRGIGGIFYDYLDSGSFENDFAFTKDVGQAFLKIYPQIVRKHMFAKWNNQQREHQLIKRGRYVEFNLLYDRGTKFGLMTGGNVEAILMSLPPEVKWP
jgi:coproporphyrinogen III oxidase